MKKAGRGCWGDVEPLWVSGLALFCLLAGGALFRKGLGLQGERYEWALYLTLGTIFPALLLGTTRLIRRLRTRPAALRVFEAAFALLLPCAAFPALLAGQPRSSFWVALPALAQLGLMVWFLRRAGLPVSGVSLLIRFFVLLVCWTAAVRFLWWLPFDAWFFEPRSTRGIAFRFAVFAASFLWVFASVMAPLAPDNGGTRVSGPRADPFRSLRLTAAAAVVFLLLSLRSDQLFTDSSFSHWAVLIGPAEMVRQGGWLLWDVPSQYGFLSTLSIALLPVGSVWQSLYVLDAFLLFASSSILFGIFRALRPSCVLHGGLSLGLTVAAVFLMPGFASELAGPQSVPSVGAFRFIWCYALLGILALYQRAERNRRKERLLLAAGCLAWLLGTLWSSESAIFCAAIWVPAHALIAWERSQGPGGPGTWGRRIGSTLVRLGVLPLLLLLSVGAITLCYLAGLGHGPDWRGFIEYSFSFSAGFFSLPIELSGPVLTLLLGFCAVATAAAYLLLHGGPVRGLALASGAGLALWATSSYFVSRSHPNNATNLSPLLFAAIAVALLVLADERDRGAEGEGWNRVIRMSAVPVLTILLTATFGNYEPIRNGFRWRNLGYQSDINQRLPRIAPSLRDLLTRAGITENDPIVFHSLKWKTFENNTNDALLGKMMGAWPVERQGREESLSPTRTWQPTMPLVLFAPLPDERRQVYMARFAERARLGGWLIQDRREPPYTAFGWFADQLKRTHRPTRTVQNADWQMIWFEFAPQP